MQFGGATDVNGRAASVLIQVRPGTASDEMSIYRPSFLSFYYNT